MPPRKKRRTPTPDPRNARLHSERNKEAVRTSLRDSGAGRSVLIDADDVIIAGNCAVEQATDLGIPIRVVDSDGSELIAVRRTDLSTDDRRRIALAIADNRTTDLSEFDDAVVAEILRDFATDELAAAGFDAVEYAELLEIVALDDPGEGLTDADAVPELVDDPTTVPGDVWLLGGHRLLCGDATDRVAVDRLMVGNKIDMVFTDPPYNVDYSSKNELLNLYNKGNHVQDDIKNDSFVDPKKYAEFIRDFYDAIEPHFADYNAIYICGNYESLIPLYKHKKLKISNMLVWAKSSMVIGRMDYQNQHEFILYGWSGRHKWFSDRKQTTVWEFPKPSASKLHPTMKPVELIEKAIRNSSRQNHLVCDPFSGSGSTIIACEKTKRKCFGIEVDPHYCDVAIKRWEQFTGETATREE